LAAGEDRGPDHTRTKHRDLHTVALSLGAQRLGDRDDGVLAGGVAGLHLAHTADKTGQGS
jgi:hypothetical protein